MTAVLEILLSETLLLMLVYVCCSTIVLASFGYHPSYLHIQIYVCFVLLVFSQRHIYIFVRSWCVCSALLRRLTAIYCSKTTYCFQLAWLPSKILLLLLLLPLLLLILPTDAWVTLQLRQPFSVIVHHFEQKKIYSESSESDKQYSEICFSKFKVVWEI